MKAIAPWVLVLLFCGTIILLPEVPHAHANSPVVNRTAAAGSSGTNCVGVACSFTLVFSQVTSSSDIIVAGVDYLLVNSSATCSGGATFSISDNESNTYTAAKSIGCTNAGVATIFYQGEIWSAPAKNTHGLSVTISWTCPPTSGAPAGCFYITSLYDISGLPTQDVTSTAANSGVTGLTLSASPQLTWTNGNPAFITSDFACDGSCNITSCGPGGTTCLNPGFGTSGLSQYVVNGTVSSPTSLTSTSSSGAGAGVFAVFSSATGVTVVIPCTPFQLQCWLYPMFFVSTYVILICGIAVRGGVGQEDLKNLALEALTIGGMLGVIVGLFNVMIPLMLVVIQVVRTLRA